MEEQYVLIKTTMEDLSDEIAISTLIEIQGINSSEVVAQMMLATINRVAYEWMLNGMEAKHCYNLFLHAVRQAEAQIEEKKKENGNT